jgi:hypothetical protein
MNGRALFLFWLTACAALPARAQEAGPDRLAASFLSPPPEARPLVWWHWINGNITREGITADLEAMRRGGLGGGIIFNVDGSAPPGAVRLASPEWHALVQHAVREAARLGLELGLHNAPGWSSSGGTWNRPEHGMQEVVTSEVRVRGPAAFTGVLPRPATALRTGYRDIAVLAFSTPAGEDRRVRDAAPRFTAGPDAAAPADNARIALPLPPADGVSYVQVEFSRPYRAQSLSFALARGVRNGAGRIEVSDDGLEFRPIDTFAITPSGQLQWASFPPTTSRFFRIVFTAVSPRPKQILISDLELSPRRVVDNLAARAFHCRAAIRPLAHDAQPGELVARENVLDLTDRLSTEGRLDWAVPAGEWTVLRVGHAPTGQVANQPPFDPAGAHLEIDPLAHAIANRPDSLAGAWLECDKLSPAAVDAHWAGMMGPVIAEAGALAGRTLRRVVIDSYEIGAQNWTPGFEKEFHRRRGYDLRPLLPVFSGRIVGSPEITDRFLWDFRRTIADLFAENYAGRFRTLAERHGMELEIEPYGNGPFDDLQYGGPAHVPLGEFWIEKGVDACSRIAVSIGHTSGRKVIGAEAFTAGSGGGNKWELDPFAMKPLGDAAFCAGINRFELHSFVHQPWLDRAPGMTLAAVGTHFDRNVTWFEPGAAWMHYLARCQALLQQGLFVADLLYCPGEGVPTSMYGGHLKLPTLPPGHEFDACAADVILKRVGVRGGRIVLPDGMSYAALLLANTGTISVPLLRKLKTLADGGARIFAPQPVKAAGLADHPVCDEEVRRIAAQLWGGGRIQPAPPLPELVRALGLPPDFTTDRPAANLAYIHRTIGEAEVYFVANPGPAVVEVEGTFRVRGLVPEFWHPDTARRERARNFVEREGRTKLPLRLDPAGAVFVVFRPTGSAPMAPARSIVATLPIDGPWELRFQPGRGAPDRVTLAHLISWPEHAEAGVRFFSGTATYTRDVHVPPEQVGAGQTLELDLGEVRNLAEVTLNGAALGVAWKRPYRIDLTSAVRAGANALEIKVTNLWPNRLIGDDHRPPDCEWLDTRLKRWPDWLQAGEPSPTGRVTFSTRRHWKKTDALLPSGLLGPVRVVVSREGAGQP